LSELSHTHDAIDLLESLVSIPSLSGQESGASTHLVEWMAARGFDARVDEVGNAVGARGDGPRQMMLLGHIDTFPGDLPVRREGDWLHGRGTVDAKGPLCAFVVAASGIDVPDGWQVAVVGAVEEEAASSRGARHILENWPIPQACVIGEPSNWDRITLGYKGRLLVDVRLRAPFVHSAGQARLPAEQAVDLWNAIVAYCDEFNAGRQKAFDRLDPSLRHIATRDEGAYGVAEMSIGFRLPLDLLPDDLAQSISHIPGLSARTGKHQTSNVEWTFSGGEVAYRAEKNTPLVRAFLSAIRKQGAKPRFVLKTGTCDMNVVGPVWDCPIVAYGPGDSSLDHTPDERINLNEYLQSIEILKSVLSQSMGVEHDAR
jgi:LysW-gamma-L-lysine carboxypeptidase